MSRPILDRERLAKFIGDMTLDALSCATASHWRRRADTLDAARPRAGDFRGRATAEDLARQDARLAEAARLCRHRADLEAELGWPADDRAMVWAELVKEATR